MISPQRYDYVVLGSGIAGLTFALNVAEKGTVAVITKKNRAESNTNYAQGGIACVTSSEDTFDLHVRDTLLKEETALNESMDSIQSEINQLRSGAALTTDATAASEIRDTSQDLQTAYDHQRQLAIDLQSMYESMLNYPITRVHPALGGFDPYEMAQPPEKRNVKSYLRFDGQRDIIATNEDKAVDLAYTAATTNCVPKGKATPTPP